MIEDSQRTQKKGQEIFLKKKCLKIKRGVF